jgi:hypothetical protein
MTRSQQVRARAEVNNMTCTREKLSNLPDNKRNKGCLVLLVQP